MRTALEIYFVLNAIVLIWQIEYLKIYDPKRPLVTYALLFGSLIQACILVQMTVYQLKKIIKNAIQL